MKHTIIKFIDKLFNLKMETSEDEVNNVKKHTLKKVKATKKTLTTAGNLQRQVMKKTTTYYLGKAAGVIK